MAVFDNGALKTENQGEAGAGRAKSAVGMTKFAAEPKYERGLAPRHGACRTV
jgi:hypothetical protein